MARIYKQFTTQMFFKYVKISSTYCTIDVTIEKFWVRVYGHLCTIFCNLLWYVFISK